METEPEYRYQLQTKLYHVEDTLVSFGPLQLTLRQCVVLMLGGSGSLRVYNLLNGYCTGVMLLLVSLVPLVLSACIAAARIADRYAEAWLVVLLASLQHESVYLWQPFVSEKKRHADEQTSTENEDYA